MDLLITNIGQLLILEGPGLGLIENACVAVDGARIAYAGPAKAFEAKRTLDAEGRPVCPGFIDPHTHLVFGGWRAEEFERRLQGTSYQQIAAEGGGILRSVAQTRAASEEQLFDHGMTVLDRMLAFGATTVEAKSGYGLNVTDELKLLRVMGALDREHPIDLVPTFMGAHEVPAEFRPRTEDYVQHVIGEQLPAVAEQGIAEFCDVFCEAGVFDVEQSRRILEAARGYGLKLKIHSDEFENLGGTELGCTLGAISADHLHVISERGVRALADSGTVGVLLPGTAFYLGGKHYAPVQKMLAAGCRLALATDFNPGSSVCENIQLMNAIAVTQMRMDPIEALRAMTINAAYALDRQATLGSLVAGKQADLCILDMPSYHHLAYHVGINQVWSVIKAGQEVVREGRRL